MHPPEARAEALRLSKAGLNDCEISRRLGISRTTIRDWRRPRYVPRRETPLETCPRCWRPAKPMRFTAEDYAELLGLYLGDGCISQHARTQRLRIALDAKYPVIVADADALLGRCFTENPVGTQSVHGGTMYFVYVYSKHLECLFPQHGPGLKYKRRIRLEDWQESLVAVAPWSLLRGLIRSDGCYFVNRTDIHRERPYEYPSYAFSNMSTGIIDLFVAACKCVGIDDYRLTRSPRGLWSVRINRRGSVALMLENVGIKE